jgi:hypothetical protein
VLYSEVDRQSFNKLPGCDNWVKEPKCPFGGGSGCLFYVSGRAYSTEKSIIIISIILRFM